MKLAARSLALLVTGVCSAAIAVAQEKSSEDLEAKSLPLRTALYNDPSLNPPLDRLIQLYQEGGRGKELIGIYRQHVAQYPADTGALTILVRLLTATNDPEAGRVVRTAAERNPENAFLQFLLFEHLQKKGEPGALDALDRAITKEKQAARKRTWVEQLLPLAAAEGRPELSKRHLESLAENSRTPEEKLDIARKMIAQKLHEPALSVLTAATAMGPSAETGVDLELAASSAELGLGRNDAAATRLDRLLGRLAADYWRRPEILHRRIALIKTNSEREAMVAAARKRWKAAPGSDSAALELSQLLAAFEFRREGLDVLLDASRSIAASEKIEKAALELFDRLRDERGREIYLAERIRIAPDRQDLALARSRSLFLLGRRADALAAFDELAGKLDTPTRVTQTLELARFLRRSALHADAAELFQRAITLVPSRIEIRRELAETLLAIGQKDKAREVFAGASPDDTETENLLDVIQFFLTQGMLLEAEDALTKRVAREPQNFDLRLMQLNVAGRLADQRVGDQLISDTLTLADTGARYRRWLEAAVAYHELFETDAAFLTHEQERLQADAGGWSPENSERRLIFAEVAAGHGRKGEVTAMLQAALKANVPPELRIELRRRQLAILENDPVRTQDADAELKALLQEDPTRADEYRIRMAVLYAKNKRADQAATVLGNGYDRELLSAIDLQKVSDAALLNALDGVMREVGNNPKVQLELLERLTTLEPANRSAWEKWLLTLASGGDEDKLRTALQRLLAGIDRLPLSAETRTVLRDHLLASYWRSLNILMRENNDGEDRLSEALPLIESAARLAQTRSQWLWITWARAYVLNQLGRTAARDEAINELERIATQTPPESPVPEKTASESSPKDNKATEGLIVFPDGLAIALDKARELLTASVDEGRAPAPMSSGPRGELRASWAFDTDAHAPVAKVLPLDATRVLILDSAGRLYCVDATSGKLRWFRDGAKPARPQRDDNYGYSGGYAAAATPPVPVHSNGRLFVITAKGIECWSSDDGRLVWRAPGVQQSGAPTTPYPSLFVRDDRLLVCDPLTSSVAALDINTGKLQWHREYPNQGTTIPLHTLNSGASFSQDRILLYGNRTLIVSAKDGDVQWSCEPKQVDEFPISLSETQPTITPPPAPSFGRSWGYPSRRSFSSMSGSGTLALNYLSGTQIRQIWIPQPGQRITLANPSVAWSSGTNDGGQPRFATLHNKRLLLFGNQGVNSLRLDTPFSGANISVSGTFLGMAGRYACVLSGNLLVSADVETGQVVRIPLSADGENNENSFWSNQAPQGDEFQAAIDGSIIYVSGRRGIAAYQAKTGQRIFDQAWPKSIAPKEAGSTRDGSVSFVPQGVFRQSNRGESTFQPAIAVVSGGIFFTKTEPFRVVAIAGKDEKQERPQ
ncbi:outer membrane protein assembly factor BamB family protein [Verrucomicrobiota bacterium sgz303538]